MITHAHHRHVDASKERFQHARFGRAESAAFGSKFPRFVMTAAEAANLSLLFWLHKSLDFPNDNRVLRPKAKFDKKFFENSQLLPCHGKSIIDSASFLIPTTQKSSMFYGIVPAKFAHPPLNFSGNFLLESSKILLRFATTNMLASGIAFA